MVNLPLPTQSNPQEYRENGDERLINCFAEIISEGKFRVRRSPGYVAVSTSANDVNCRGAIEADGFIYAVFEGGTTVKIAQDGTRTTIGHIGGTGFVDMARNAATPFEIGCVVPETGKYYVIQSDAVSIVDTRDLPSFNSIAWVSGYFVLGVPDGRFFNTGLNNARSINGLDFATAEGAPDGLKRVFASRLEIVLAGEKTIEFWALSSDPPAEGQGSPFVRLGGAVVGKGAGSAFSFAAIDNSFMWVGDDGKVYRNANYSPERVSHYGVERSIAGQADKSLIRASSYAIGGNEFYQLSGDNFTWVYNAATQRWHELQSYLAGRINADVHVSAWDGVYCLTRVDGNLYKLTPDVANEAGQPLIATMRFPDISERGVVISMFEADILTGRAPITGAANVVEPTIELLWSDDGGASWSNPRQFSVGTQGQYDKRIRATRLGQTGKKYGRRFELRISDPHVLNVTEVRLNEA